ncbi:MAG TPA: hypothetical protein VFI31_00335 [Pirellulales bacterium]|nr:hypothetical protein [Pirellulales bacterium]
MPRRFQFSLRRLFGATALFAVALWLLGLVYSAENGLAVTVFPLVLGSAVGALLGRARVGAVVGWCLLPIWWLVIVVALSFRE